MRKILFSIVILFTGMSCDSPKSKFTDIEAQALCYNLGTCNPSRGVKFGMLGDSWTDLLFGTNVIDSLRVQLERNHGYSILGSTIGGQEMEMAYKQGLHFKIIDEAGPSLKYVLVSLGGNDLQRNPVDFINNREAAFSTRFATIKENLFNMIRTGNSYKIQKWGGNNLLWIIHGYDYTNPEKYTYENATSCRITLKNLGFTDELVDYFSTAALDEYNEFLKNLTFEEPNLRYIDLRGTLQQGKFSNPDLMFDCIHPNSLGFQILAERYVKTLEGYTNNER
jgi:lysophospholipase L1-like esterase